ncbi:ANK3 [Symbiodinium sp. CCMP2592]|nr:ANK3 [Symbiodinium sp. CCMP2592]
MLVEDEGRFLESANARFTRFSDRYQKPVGAAKYRDWLFLLKIGDFACELQVNFELAVQVKEQEQHHEYELQRLATRKLLESAMRNDYGMVHLLLASNGLHGESLVNARDCHGFTPLHYAARHGNALMLELLLKRGADVLALDREGLPPLHHALAMVHPDACQKLLRAMEGLPKERLRKEPLASTVQGMWATAFQTQSDEIHELAEKLAQVAKSAYSTPGQHLQAIARSGDVSAMRAAYKTLPMSYVRLGWVSIPWDPVQCGFVKMLDLAILSGSAAMAAMVAQPHQHGAPSRIQDRGGDLDMHAEPQHVERLVRQGRVARFRALHAVRPPDTRRMAELLVVAAEHDQLEMAHQIWTLGGGGLAAALTDEEKVKLVELGLHAAALGHEDFVRLLIEAKAPLDKVIGTGETRMIRQAAATGQTAIVELLAEAGADTRDQVLAAAVTKGHYETAALLLRRGGDPKESWGGGEQPAYSIIGQAILKNRPEMLQLLAQYGADTYTDENLEFAEEQQAFDCLEFMRRSGEAACPA